MTLVLVVRHGLTAATGSALTGRQAGVPLDGRGLEQAAALAERLAGVRLDAIVSSPIERCVQTAEAIAARRPPDRDGNGRPAFVPVQLDDRLIECGYGDWTGQPLRKLSKEPLWRVVQAHPSAAKFPGPDGESLADVAHRAVQAVRDWNARLGPKAVYLICSHGDVIKAILADSLGMHLDMFQRIVVDPCSLNVIRYTPLRPFVERMNDTGGSVRALARPQPAGPEASAVRPGDAPVGGGAGG